ncbi:MAG: FixH family protein [Gammaproteobacteria bacterium]|nr:FixH family protein [Gammaproteobacteria bacterium]MBT8436842.1 FixH family protein [Gammaproteobacteria bacterium]
MMDSSETAPRNWKREPMVWLLIAIPFSAVIMGVVIITLAVQSFSGLVVDDYYKKGKEINRVLARDQLAYELGLAAGLSLEAGGKFEIRFAPEVQFIPGDTIELKLIHATMPGLDQKLDLRKSDTHLLRGQLELPGEGRWNLFLQTEDWRLTGSLQYPDQMSVDLLPNYFPE